MKNFLLSFFLGMAVLFTVSYAFADAGPDFSSVTRADNGKPFSMSEIAPGHRSVLVYFDPTCPHCQSEIADIQKNAASFAPLNLILVSYADSTEIMKFIKSHPVLRSKVFITPLHDDSPYSLMRSLDVEGVPALFIYDEKMKLKKRFDGETPIADIIKAL